MRYFNSWAIATICIGLIAVILSVTAGVEWFKVTKPFFHLSLFIFYFSRTKKFNLVLQLFLVSTMIAEFLAATNFLKYITYIILLFMTYFSLGSYLLWPLVKFTRPTKLRLVDLLIAIGGTILLVYVIFSIFVFSAEQIEQFALFVLATLSFCLFIALLFYITGFHNDPKKIMAFVVGVCYVIICTGSLLYELQYPFVELLGLVNLSEVIAQFTFVLFLTFFDQLMKRKQWHI